MQILIWGAGAIGGTLGAYLIREGHDVLFVDIVETHVAVLNQKGLRITGTIEEFTVPAKAVTPQNLSGQYEVILLCTKAQHTQIATEALKPFLKDDGYVVSVQNGLNELIIRDIVGVDRTVGAFVNFGADYHAPGDIFFGGRGAVVLGELDGSTTERLKMLESLFLKFDDSTKITNDLWGYLWGKEAYGAMLFITALTNDSIADALADKRYESLYVRAAQEVLRVARATGIQPRAFNGFEPAAFLNDDESGIQQSMAALVAFNRKSAKTHSGIWRDLAVRKRKTEVAMFDTILAEGRRVNIAMPLTERWIMMIHEIEAGQREQSHANLDELKADFS
ncbi:MAG: ketopantoate reductase family protein [Aggregatilineales bacterium]